MLQPEPRHFLDERYADSTNPRLVVCFDGIGIRKITAEKALEIVPVDPEAAEQLDRDVLGVERDLEIVAVDADGNTIAALAGSSKGAVVTAEANDEQPDTGALAEAANALQSLLERCPDYAPEIERLASIACFASRRGNVPHLIAKLAKSGIEAGTLVVGEERSSKSSAILLLSLAEAELIAERRLEGLDALRRLKSRLDASPVEDALGPWITARMHVLLGGLHELGLEQEQARPAQPGAQSMTSSSCAPARTI